MRGKYYLYITHEVELDRSKSEEEILREAEEAIRKELERSDVVFTFVGKWIELPPFSRRYVCGKSGRTWFCGELNIWTNIDYRYSLGKVSKTVELEITVFGRRTKKEIAEGGDRVKPVALLGKAMDVLAEGLESEDEFVRALVESMA